MMNPELKAKWLAALRSGDYPQTVHWLHRTAGDLHSNVDGLRHVEGYCCLGVLCDISGHSSWNGKEMSGMPSQIPTSIAVEFGIHTEAQHLMAMNDSGRFSFDAIADYIEGKL